MKITDAAVSKLAKIRDYKFALDTLAKQTTLHLDHLRGGMPLNQLAVFFEIASAQSLGMYPTTADIRLKLELDRRAVSRYLKALGEQDHDGGEGLQLIEFVENTADKRVKRIALTRKGEELALNLAQHLRNAVIENADSINTLTKDKLSDCLCMLGVDEDIPLNIYVVRKPYNIGLYSFMRQRMYSDISGYNVSYPSLVVLERRLLASAAEMKKMVTNLSAVHETDQTHLYMWLASNETPPALAARLNRLVKRSRQNPAASFFSTLDEIRQAVGLPRNWSLPDLTPYE